MKNKDFKISFIFTIIGAISGGLLGLFQISSFTEEIRQQVIGQLGSIGSVIAITTVQTAIFAFVSTFFGLKLARKVNLKLNFKLKKDSLRLTAIIGMVSALIISASDKFIFAKYLPLQTESYRFSPLYFLSSILYGGIVEELMLRLFLMSLIILILWKVFAKSYSETAIPDWVYISSIFIAAILFAAGHLPATAQLLGLSTPIVIRSFLLNGVAGIGFGYLYWRRGLSYAIYAHMLAHIFNQLLFMPIFFR